MEQRTVPFPGLWAGGYGCLRVYTRYESEANTDEGEDSEAAVSGWSDVADYMDEHMI